MITEFKLFEGKLDNVAIAAAEADDMEIFDLAVKKGASMKSSRIVNALIKYGHFDKAKKCLELGSEINIDTISNAMKVKNLELLKLAIDKYKYDLSSYLDRFTSSDLKCFKYIYEKVKSKDYSRYQVNYWNNRVVYYVIGSALYGSNSEIVEYVITEEKLDPNYLINDTRFNIYGSHRKPWILDCNINFFKWFLEKYEPKISDFVLKIICEKRKYATDFVEFMLKNYPQSGKFYTKIPKKIIRFL